MADKLSLPRLIGRLRLPRPRQISTHRGMTRLWIRTILNLALVAALLVATVLSSAAHRLPLELTDPGAASILQMGGSIADICGDGPTERSKTGCEICNLLGAAVAPDLPCTVITLDFPRAAPFITHPRPYIFASLRHRADAIRAPPAV
ncbi:hypothetical protein [uncultured Litoreibacter sp.]|uniref:hypothetical protein n=2 Tax=uncultured Litoreibacter sp. TaxID=1392394 RepID=UPI00260E3DBD|nr:hypothetical protein [uncultured Litoreibacter sp.]